MHRKAFEKEEKVLGRGLGIFINQMSVEEN